jgi:protein CpxP
MNKHTKVIALIFAGALLAVGSIQAADHHGKKQFGGKMMHMLEKLDLTDTQHSAIKTIKEAQHASKMAHKEQMKTIREGMRKQVESDTMDISEVRNLAHQKSLLVETMTVMKGQSMHQIHQQLTAEQRVKLNKMKDRMHRKMQEKHAHKH